MAREYKLTLLENGLDFIAVGLEGYFSDSESGKAHKYALLHVFAGVLLLFKERLRREHEAFIYEKVTDVSADPGAKRNTVNFTSAIDRLRTIAKVTFTDADENLLNRVQKIRNELEHSSASLQLKDTQKLVGRLMVFVCMFLRDHLNEKLEAHVSQATRRQVIEAEEIAKRIEEEALATWRTKAARYENLTDADLEGIADENQSDPRDNPGRGYPICCPKCGDESAYSLEPDIGICTNKDCKTVIRTTSCESCKAPVFDDAVFCNDCQSYLDHQLEKH